MSHMGCACLRAIYINGCNDHLISVNTTLSTESCLLIGDNPKMV